MKTGKIISLETIVTALYTSLGKKSKIVLITHWQVGNNVKRSPCGKMCERKQQDFLAQIFRKWEEPNQNSLENHLFLTKLDEVKHHFDLSSNILMLRISHDSTKAFQNSRQLQMIKTAEKRGKLPRNH